MQVILVIFYGLAALPDLSPGTCGPPLDGPPGFSPRAAGFPYRVLRDRSCRTFRRWQTKRASAYLGGSKL